MSVEPREIGVAARSACPHPIALNSFLNKDSERIRLGAGHFFGEVAALRRARRSGTATAVTRASNGIDVAEVLEVYQQACCECDPNGSSGKIMMVNHWTGTTGHGLAHFLFFAVMVAMILYPVGRCTRDLRASGVSLRAVGPPS
jgi:hypothetical protein